MSGDLVGIERDDLRWLIDNTDEIQFQTPESRGRLERIAEALTAAQHKPTTEDIVQAIRLEASDGDSNDGGLLAIAATPEAAERWTAIYNMNRYGTLAVYKGHQVIR